MGAPSATRSVKYQAEFASNWLRPYWHPDRLQSRKRAYPSPRKAPRESPIEHSRDNFNIITPPTIQSPIPTPLRRSDLNTAKRLNLTNTPPPYPSMTLRHPQPIPIPSYSLEASRHYPHFSNDALSRPKRQEAVPYSDSFRPIIEFEIDPVSLDRLFAR